MIQRSLGNLYARSVTSNILDLDMIQRSRGNLPSRIMTSRLQDFAMFQRSRGAVPFIVVTCLRIFNILLCFSVVVVTLIIVT